ncbi:MAG: AraC family transcriptional regulator [Firmicutes bacterium]|nr:AraC family transcriptional regulator [Bacillota bacterium]
MMSETMSRTKLNMDDVLSAAKDYALSTGVECLVLTQNGKSIVNPCEGKFHSELCYCKSGAIGKCCLNAHFEGAIKATDPEHHPAYYCPMGLLHWASPIIIEGKIEAAFIAGHTFLNQSPSELAYLKNITTSHEELLKAYPELKKTLMNSPVITQERLDGLKNMLDRVAASFSDRSIGDLAYRDMREAFRKSTSKNEENIAAIPWQKLTESCDKKNPEMLDSEIREVVEAMERLGDVKQCKAALAQLVLSIYDCCLEKEGQCFLSDRCLNAMNDLERMKSVSELAEWTKDNLRSLLEAGSIVPNLKNADMIYSALQYIEDHYNERFSLQDIADYVHFSAPYFSKVFKKEMDITFTKYITNVRIEKSKQLLKNTKYPLADIPAMVGFEEQSYFTRVFRTTTGISPGKYRESYAALN